MYGNQIFWILNKNSKTSLILMDLELTALKRLVINRALGFRRLARNEEITPEFLFFCRICHLNDF